MIKARQQEIKDRLGNIVKGKWEQNQSNVTVNGHTLFFTYMANRRDAEFIAHAPTDIKFLLDALEQAHERERVLRDFIDTQFCQNFKKYGKSTMCHHPDNGLCDKYYDCMALDKVLKEDKPND